MRSGPAALAAALALFAVPRAPAAAQGEEVGWTVRVEEQVFRDDGGGKLPLEEGRTVRAGWRLTTGPRSLALVQLFPRGILGLCAESDLTIDRQPLAGLTEACPKLVVEEKVRACLRVSGVLAYGGCKLRVETGEITVDARATDFAVLVDPVYGTRVLVFEGEVEVRGRDDRVLGVLAAGQMGRVERVGRRAAAVLEVGPAPPPEAAGGPLGALPFPDPPLLPRGGVDVVNPRADFDPGGPGP